jgi:biotin operon repressor
MTPKEKAKDLIDKFSTRLKVLHELEGWVIHIDSSKAKGHALTAVNLLLNDKL